MLQEASYLYQENSLWRLHTDRQKVLAAREAEEGEKGGVVIPPSENLRELVYFLLPPKP